MVTADNSTNRQLTIDKDEFVLESDSDDDDSALMEDARSEPISSTSTTGSLSMSDDDSTIEQSSKLDRIQSVLDDQSTSKKKRQQRELLTKYARTRRGLIDNHCRQRAWPHLIDSPSYCPIQEDKTQNKFVCPIDYYAADKTEIESHRYYGQVRMDVERTLKRFPPNYAHSERIELQEELIIVIVKFLIKHDKLNYYQGYHDICLTFLLVLGSETCLPLIDTITKSHFKDFMEPTMEKTRDLLSYLMPLINCVNSECAEYMQRGGVGNVMFALSWFITWYSHVLDKLDTILRLYDLFIVSHFLMPIYVAAEIVNFHADRVLSVDCDMPSLHQLLSRLPSELDDDTWEEIVERALHLFTNHHPDTLDVLNDEWRKKCEYLDSSPIESTLRRRYGSDSPDFDDQQSSSDLVDSNEHQGALPRIVLWGVTLTISGLAIYIWNHSQRSDPAAFISLGDFLAQLYGK